MSRKRTAVDGVLQVGNDEHGEEDVPDRKSKTSEGDEDLLKARKNVPSSCKSFW